MRICVLSFILLTTSCAEDEKNPLQIIHTEQPQRNSGNIASPPINTTVGIGFSHGDGRHLPTHAQKYTILQKSIFDELNFNFHASLEAPAIVKNHDSSSIALTYMVYSNKKEQNYLIKSKRYIDSDQKRIGTVYFPKAHKCRSIATINEKTFTRGECVKAFILYIPKENRTIIRINGTPIN